MGVNWTFLSTLRTLLQEKNDILHVIGNNGGISVHNPVLNDDIEFPKMIQTSLYISGSQAFPYGASEWGQLFLESTQVYEQNGVPFAW